MTEPEPDEHSPSSAQGKAGERSRPNAKGEPGERSHAAPISGHPRSEPASRTPLQTTPLQTTPLQYPEFERVDMRVGIVTDAREFPEARRPAYQLWIDFGPLGVKRSSAQITKYYQPAELIGRRVVAVVNFPPKQIGPFRSEVLVLGAYDDAGEVILLHPDKPVAPGSKIG